MAEAGGFILKYIYARNTLTPDGWKADLEIGITEDGKIGYVGKPEGRSSARFEILLPGSTNLHSHSFQRAISGLTEHKGPYPGDSFWTWRRLMYRFLDQLDPDQIEAIAALAFMEMLEAGYSSVAEFHYLHHASGGSRFDRLSELSDRIIAAAEKSGIGLTLLPVFYEFGGCDKRELHGSQLRFKNNLDQFGRLFEEAETSISGSESDYNIGVAPHSPRAVSADAIARLETIADGNPFHIHVAEQKAEVDEVLEHFGATPVEWLLSNADVSSGWCLIHCTHMTLQETEKLACSGAVAGLCPITESSLGDGIFEGVEFLRKGGKIGFGSDSNIQVSLFEELKTLEYSQRLRDNSRVALATAEKSVGRNLFDHALAGGARASQRKSGAISVGYWADMAGIRSNNAALAGRTGDIAIDTLVFGGNAKSCISDVWSAGRHVVQDGRHVHREILEKKYLDSLAHLRDGL